MGFYLKAISTFTFLYSEKAEGKQGKERGEESRCGIYMARAIGYGELS